MRVLRGKVAPGGEMALVARMVDVETKKPLVTVLCGFLGAGKTTLLKHVLTQANGARWAAIVNDVAAINIDAALVRSSGGATVATKDVVELGNGCVCCSSRDELAEALAELASTGFPQGPAGVPYAHIWVETTGVAEPRGIATLFTRRNPFGRSLADFATLAGLITVVDAAAFLREWAATQEPGKTVMPSSGPRPLFELLVEQVECADLVVLNKMDLVSADERRQVAVLVAGLNERAEQIETEQGQVPSETLVGRIRFDAAKTLGAAAWVRTLNAVSAAAPAGGLVVRPVPAMGGRPRHEERFGIRSFVYQARRPFVTSRLQALLRSGVPGLLRAKGFYWTVEQPDEMRFLSVAGGVVRFETLHYWGAALVEAGKARRDELPELVRAQWQEPAGDRRQELVFIGVCLDEEAVRAALDGCAA